MRVQYSTTTAHPWGRRTKSHDPKPLELGPGLGRWATDGDFSRGIPWNE